MGLGKNSPLHYLGLLKVPDFPLDAALESDYNNMARRPDAAELMQHLSELSQAYRGKADAALDCAYGNHDRERIDIFRCGQAGAPLFAYIHGGYWQRGDKSIYSYLAEPLNTASVDVAIIGYPLCPEVSMTSLLGTIKSALAWLYRNASALGVTGERINLSGHSAGGHLTAMAQATCWPEYAGDLPTDLLKSTIPISGLYLLEPLRHTTISDALHLTDDETNQLSPALLSADHAAPMLAIVGGAESPGFFEQTERLIEAWSRPLVVIDKYIEPGADHFDVVARLHSSDSAIFQRILAWLN
jgi:arylformamidase